MKHINWNKNFVKRKDKCFIGASVLVLTLLVSGCHMAEEKNETNAQLENEYVSCDTSIDKETYLEQLKNLDTEKDTVLIYTADVYTDSAIHELNQLLEKEGYSWQVQVRQIPDVYWYDGAVQNLISDLAEEEIPADIITFSWADLYTAAKADLLVDMSAYLNTEDGLKLKEVISDKYWELTEIDGCYYGVAALDAPESSGWAVNKELMDKYNFTDEDLAKPLEELESVFETVTQGEKANPDFTAFPMIPGYLFYRLPFYFVDSTLPIGYWQESNVTDVPEKENFQVVNIFDTDQMRNLTEVLNDYFQKGYIRNCTEGLNFNKDFFMQPDYNGYSVRRSDDMDSWTNENGILLKRIRYYESDLTDLFVYGNAILKTSSHQEEALKCLKFMLSDENASNALLYGQEGTNYEITDGTIEAGDNLTEYDCSERQLANFLISLPVTPFEDNTKSEVIMEAINETVDTPLYHFQFDESKVQKQVDAVREVYGQMENFRSMFMFEKTDDMVEENWQEYYENYCQKLKAAGIDEVVEEMNRQLEEYLN